MTLDVENLTKEVLDLHDLTHLNEIHFYLQGFRKKIKNGFTLSEIEKEFEEIKNSSLMKIEGSLREFTEKRSFFFLSKIDA